MTNKKQKLLSGILVSASTLAVAASVTGLVIGLNKDKSTHPSFLNGKTVNFSAGEGSINKNQPKSTTVESGTTFDRVDQPAVTSNNPKKIFGGWKDQDGSLVRGDATVRKDMNLTATYNDADSSEYVTVLFTTDPSEPGPVLQGNQRISVNKGYYFFMVNRPTAKWTVTTSEGVTKQKYFKGWRYSDGTQVSENDKMTSNVTLYPIFNEAVTVTWHPDGAHETGTPEGKGAIERGQETTTLETGATFHDFNQPALKYVDKTSGEAVTGAYFAGWYKDSGCTEEWDESATLSADADAYAKWAKEPEVGDQYGTIEFADARDTMVDGTKLPTTLTYGWTPTDKIVVKLNDKTWGDTNKPSVVVYNSSVITNDYRTGAWEIALGTKEEGKEIEYGDYKTLSDSYVFPSGTKYYKIRPVLQYAIDSITVYGDETVQLESTSQYNVIIEGGSTSAQKVTWSLLTEDGKAFPDGIAKISDSGLVTIASPSRELWETYGYSCFVVKAQSQLDPSQSSTLKVNLSMPYTDNMYVWIHTESSESSNPKWYYADMDAFCDTSSTALVAYAYSDPTGATTKSFDKTADFTDTLTFGTDLYSIPDNFLAGWTNFKGFVDLKNSNVVIIGNEFMAGCTNFNTELYLSKLISIGANFLKGCTSYDTEISFLDSAPLTWIGEGFLNSCTKFNSKITLPTITSFEIESGFMYNCTSFNQPLSLPSIISYIGDFFMCECKAFTSALDVNVEMSKFVASDGSLSSVDSTAAIYATGFTVTGNKSEDFCKYYTTIKGDHYRTIRTGSFDGQVTSAEFTKAKTALASAFNLTASMSGLGTLYLVSDSSNADDWTTGKIVDADGDNWYIKHNSLGADALEDWYIADGSYKNSRLLSDEDSISYKVTFLHGVLGYTSSDIEDWTFDSSNKWYSFTAGGDKFIIRFEGTNKTIDYFAYVNNGVTAFATSISNIGTTTITDVPTLSHLTDATYSSGSFTATDTAAVPEDNHYISFQFKLDSTSLANNPNAFLYHAAISDNDYLKPSNNAVLYHYDTTLSTPAWTKTYLKHETLASYTNDVVVYEKDESGNDVTWAAGDILRLEFDAGGALSKTISFSATPTVITTMTVNSAEKTTSAGVSAYWDEDCTNLFSLNTALNVSEGTAFKFYIKLKGAAGFGDTIDETKSYYTLGEGGKKYFSEEDTKIAVTNTTVSEDLTERVCEITVDADAITDVCAIQLNYTSTTTAVTMSSASSTANMTLWTSDGDELSWDAPAFADKESDYSFILEVDSSSLTTLSQEVVDMANSTISVDGGADQSFTSAGITVVYDTNSFGALRDYTVTIPKAKLGAQLAIKFAYTIDSTLTTTTLSVTQTQPSEEKEKQITLYRGDDWTTTLPSSLPIYIGHAVEIDAKIPLDENGDPLWDFYTDPDQPENGSTYTNEDGTFTLNRKVRTATGEDKSWLYLIIDSSVFAKGPVSIHLRWKAHS